jgi:outer membrane receptor protein involved in Fe transport
MIRIFARRGLLARQVVASLAPIVVLVPGAGRAQEPVGAQEPPLLEEVVVTGSRIRQAQTQSAAPLTVISAQQVQDLGFAQVGQALNQASSMTPSYASADGRGNASGSGQQAPNLFNLGAGRTLTLVDGRRTITTASGLDDPQVDTNIIPTGLLERIDVVQAGGAATYGSDAIAGVVNYVLKKSFEGATINVQSGISSRGDYPENSVSATLGHNFDDHRGNLSFDAEWHKTDPLLFGSRPITDPVVRSFQNPQNPTGDPTLPARVPVWDPHFWEFNDSGVIFSSPAPVMSQILNQFSKDGKSVAAYNPGAQYVPGFPCAIPFCTGGDGYPYNNLAALYTGVEAYSATGLGHFDFSEHFKLSAQLSYARTIATDPLGSQAPEASVIGGVTGAIPFTNTNPYLTPAEVASLSALSPAFAGGAPLYVSKAFDDLLPTRKYEFGNDIYQAVIQADGDFSALNRNFYYSAYYTHGYVRGQQSGWVVNSNNFQNAIDVAANGAGQAVCAENAVAVVDPACAPLNPFGQGNISAAARAYVTAPNGSTYHNRQDDWVATLGGEALSLPSGAVKFSLTYEHRIESAEFTPSLADQLDYAGHGASLPASGKFSTNEYAGEVLLPLLGNDFALPFVKALELSGQFRRVNNTIAGQENVWSTGGRWDTGTGFTLRATRSRNFRAPTLTQLFTPATAGLQNADDPCDQRNLNTGVMPATRRANCEALFAQHPNWGPLASFVDPSVNFGTVNVSTGGNPQLVNEVANTTSFGLAWQPGYVPGQLMLTVDHIHVNILNGLTPFSQSQFTDSCFDSPSMPASLCSTFTRDPSTGYIATATSSTFNAAVVVYSGDVLNLNYKFPFAWISRHADTGGVEIALDATHNENLSTSVQGATTQQAGTTAVPSWALHGNIRYRIGGFGFLYDIHYLPSTKVNLFDTALTTPWPNIPSNTVHSVSFSYDFSKYQIRAGVTNLTDQGPSFPTFNYGDVIGREFFVGLKASL